jgi:TolA-binding protein
VKVNLAAMNEKFGEKLEIIEMKGNSVIARVELIQEQLNEQQESNRRLEADNVEMKKSLNEIAKQLERRTQQIPHDGQAEEMKKGIAEADGMDREPKGVVAGGENQRCPSNSVEMFSLGTGTWTPLQPMKENRDGSYLQQSLFCHGRLA